MTEANESSAGIIPQVEVAFLTDEQLFDNLAKIHEDVQERFHDQWDGRGASFYLAVIKAIFYAKNRTIARAEAHIARLKRAALKGDAYEA